MLPFAKRREFRFPRRELQYNAHIGRLKKEYQRSFGRTISYITGQRQFHGRRKERRTRIRIRVAKSAVHVPLFSDTIIKLRMSWFVLVFVR
jgi:hypothetical protein